MTDLLPGSPSFFNDGDQAEVLPAAHQPRKVAKRKSASTDPTAPAQNAKAGTSGHRTAEQEEILYIQKLCQMSGPELEVEKKKVKSGLKAFDEDFYRRYVCTKERQYVHGRETHQIAPVVGTAATPVNWRRKRFAQNTNCTTTSSSSLPMPRKLRLGIVPRKPQFHLRRNFCNAGSVDLKVNSRHVSAAR